MNSQIEMDLERVFKQFDSDNNGYIQLNQLRKVAESLGQNISEQKAKKIIQKLDINHDGKIQLEQFKQWWINGFKGKMGRLVYLKAKSSKFAKNILNILEQKGSKSKKKHTNNENNRYNIELNFGQQNKNGLTIKFQAYYKGYELLNKLQKLKTVIPNLNQQYLTFFIILPIDENTDGHKELINFIDQFKNASLLPQEIQDPLDNAFFNLKIQACNQGTILKFQVKEGVVNLFNSFLNKIAEVNKNMTQEKDNFIVDFQFKTNFSLQDLLEKQNILENLLKGFLLRLKLQLPKNIFDQIRSIVQNKLSSNQQDFSISTQDIFLYLLKAVQFKIKLKSPAMIQNFFKRIGIEEILKQAPNLQAILESYSKDPTFMEMKNDKQNPLHSIYMIISFMKKYFPSGIQIGVCWKQIAIHLQLRYPGLHKIFNCLFNQA